MKNPVLQLMIHGDQDIATSITVNYPGVQLYNAYTNRKINTIVFVDLKIGPNAMPGTVNIKVGNEKLLPTISSQSTMAMAVQE